MTVVRKHPMADCEECPLYEVGTYVQTTFPSKPCSTGNQLAIIGEAPGTNEIRRKRVFIGESGKVLDGTLGILGIDRGEVLLTNASACHYQKTKDTDKLPKAAVEHCRPRLLWELEQAGVNMAITLGAYGLTSLIATKRGITNERAGGPRPSTYAPGVLVVPTYHPAYAMRDHTKFPDMLCDMAKARSGKAWEPWPEVRYRVVRSVEDAQTELARFWNKSVRPLIVDTESGRDKDSTFGGAIKEVLCIGIHDVELDEEVVFPVSVLADDNRRSLGALLMRNGIDGQNIKYDVCRVLNVYLGVDARLDIRIMGDRMLQSYCIRETPGIHGLGYMGVEHLGAPDWKPWIDESMEEGRRAAKAAAKARKEKLGKRFNGLNYAFVDPEVLYKYNAYDVAATHRLEAFFDEDLDRVPGLRDLYNRLLDYSNMLVHVEQNGMAVDLDYNAALEEEFRAELGEIEFDTGGQNFNTAKTRKDKTALFNPNAPHQVKAFLESLGIDVPNTQRGTIDDIIKHCEITGERDDLLDFCKTLLTYRGDSKVLNTYILGLRNTLIDGAIHPDFSLLSTSGRLKGREPNPQNFPRGWKLRRQIVPRPGKIFVHADYAQAELRVMAWLAKDENLRALFADTSIDIFNNIAIKMWGQSTFDSWADEYAKNIRGSLVKPMAYGSAYGRGPNAIADSWGIPLWEARKMQQEFFKLIPDVVKEQERIAEMAVAGEDIVTVFGRRRRFRLVTGQNYVDVMNEAKAFKPQSVANDICLTAAVELDKQGLPLVNLIHDDIMAEVDKCDAEEAMRLMSKTMVETAELICEGFVKFKADAGTGMSYGDLK